jgi:putative Holliday junction resolvase
MRSLSLDRGERRIGVALSDPIGVSARPLEVLSHLHPEGLLTYEQEKNEKGRGIVVVGMPLTCKGEEGEQARITREYAKVLEGIEGIELVFWDERFSTREAERKLREAGRSLKGKEVDAEAAAVILQSYLEYIGGDVKREKEDRGQ